MFQTVLFGENLCTCISSFFFFFFGDPMCPILCSIGVFIAGLDAGLVYKSFHKMAGQWIPDDLLTLSPKIKSMVKNTTTYTVQFNHHILVSIVRVCVCVCVCVLCL